jgi:hypothetical protein
VPCELTIASTLLKTSGRQLLGHASSAACGPIPTRPKPSAVVARHLSSIARKTLNLAKRKCGVRLWLTRPALESLL